MLATPPSSAGDRLQHDADVRIFPHRSEDLDRASGTPTLMSSRMKNPGHDRCGAGVHRAGAIDVIPSASAQREVRPMRLDEASTIRR